MHAQAVAIAVHFLPCSKDLNPMIAERGRSVLVMRARYIDEK